MRWDAFTVAYVEAALWSSDLVGKGEISAECQDRMLSDCAQFQRAHGNLIDAAETPDRNEAAKQKRAGADFWLTRNRHGAGFWDGDWSEPQATKLTDAAHRFGEFELYESDDGLVECYPSQNPLSSNAVLVGGVAALAVVGVIVFIIAQNKSSQLQAAATAASQQGVPIA